MKYVGENALKKWTSLVKSDIKKKLDKNQGTANSGKILSVDTSGEVAPTDTELVDVPNGIVKGDGSTLSAAVADMDYMVPPTGGTTGQILKKTETGTEWADAPQTVTILETTALLKGDGNGGVSAAVAGTDYMAPVTGGTAGQVLTKTADGQEWKDREKSMFIVTISGVYGQAFTTDKTFLEIQEAYDAGKVCFALYTEIVLPLIAFDREIGVGFGQKMNRGLFYSFLIGADDTITLNVYEAQNKITASGLLKGDGKGGISAATAGTDYVAPNGDASNVTAAFTAASTRANVATGEKLSVLFGKIAKWFADLGGLAFKSTVAKSDLASDVQTSLDKADSALQSVSKSDVGLDNVANERQYSSANPPPYPVTSVNGKTGAVTVESSSGTTYNATLSSSGWTTSGSYKKQTVTVTGLKANYPVAPVVDAQLTGTDADGDTAVLNGFSAINLIQTAENQLIAYCIGDAPTVNIPLIINTWG